MVFKNGKVTYCEYVEFEGDKLCTVVCLPKKQGKFPTVIFRSPYARPLSVQTTEEECNIRIDEYKAWTDSGFAVVLQHSKGTGKSTGDFIPYIYDRNESLSLEEWIRKQEFYNGELYLYGASYDATVHIVTAPFAPDIKGAVLEMQDSNRYNICYRNGFFKMGLHGDWYAAMYKLNSLKKRNYTVESYNMLPLKSFSKTVFGEEVKEFDEFLKHPDINDAFWSGEYSGIEFHEAIKHANIPILLTTGFYDIYTGGVFDMWNGLDDETRKKCALAVHPFEHGGSGNEEPVKFENGVMSKEYENYIIRWLDFVRGKSGAPFKQGKVTYYKLFDNKWCTDDFSPAQSFKKIPLGTGEVTYRYNPYNPASFKGGLSANFGSNKWQDEPNSRYDIISLFTEEFTSDTFVKGKIRAKLRVKSSCEDTCFYIRISLCKKEGYYGLRDDINRISNFETDYRPNSETEMDFFFDEHAFVIKKGEKLRIDISSSAFPHYVRHTNNKGLFSEQTDAKIADNTVILDKSYIEIPIK